MGWNEIVQEADGQTVYFYMWGGSDITNNWVTRSLADRLREKYSIELNMVPVNGPQVYINKVLGEKQAGRVENGSVDLVWINGENFRTMRQADLLFGPFSQRLPNLTYVDTEDASIAYDFGYPVQGYESPYGAAQMVMVYDSERLPTPPRTIGALIRWIKANPGKFTYPALPDFTGSAFIRHLFYHANGGTDGLLGLFNEKKYEEVSGKFFSLLQELEPYLWRSGDAYPENLAKLEDLFANGEVLLSFNYGPGEAAVKIRQGRFPVSVRTYVFEEGTIANTNFLAIPFNSSNKAAAMVVANEILDPAVQFNMAVERNSWPLVLDMKRIPAEWREKIDSIDMHPSILSAEELGEHILPEMMAEWLVRIEEDWKALILER